MMDHGSLFSMLQPGMDGRYYYVKKRGKISIKMISRSDDPEDQGLDSLILWTSDELLYLDQELDDGLEVLALIPTCEELVAIVDDAQWDSPKDETGVRRGSVGSWQWISKDMGEEP